MAMETWARSKDTQRMGFAHFVLDKGLIFKIYKELTELRSKTRNQSKTWEEDRWTDTFLVKTYRQMSY